jgi:hypothetical protein
MTKRATVALLISGAAAIGKDDAGDGTRLDAAGGAILARPWRDRT